jgi:hypothetical protein
MFCKKLKNEVKQLEQELARALEVKSKLLMYNDELADHVEHMHKKFPFDLGQVVYDVQLRSSKGRFTKTKASKEHSLINEVVVDKKNYFNLVDRYNSLDVFVTRDAAQKHIDDVCIE